ncbi:MAG TPA: ribbon-helix-helix domain-containing protein [Chloroflexota bacterium]|nr:ribbon-helix-helix domain-containing protein [Chloroflexota bacterium]
MDTPNEAPKRRSQIMLDDELYHGLAVEAEIQGRSISALVREAVAAWLEPRRPRRIQETPFWSLVGRGRSGQTGAEPVSDNVDRYLYPDPHREHADPRQVAEGPDCHRSS